MKIKEEFSKYAKSYCKNSIIQQKCSEILTAHLPNNLQSVIELGCGDGRVFKQIKKKDFKKYLAVDFSKEMLALHPRAKNLILLEGDFNDKNFFDKLDFFNIAISSSALQWAKDLNFTFNQIAKKAGTGYFFLFTSDTFKSLHKIAEVKSPIYDKIKIKEAFLNSFSPKIIKSYDFRLYFNDTWKMLKYIKNSGVGGSVNLSVLQVRKILKNYNKPYLEFSTILLIGKSLENR